MCIFWLSGFAIGFTAGLLTVILTENRTRPVGLSDTLNAFKGGMNRDTAQTPLSRPDYVHSPYLFYEACAGGFGPTEACASEGV